MVFVLAYAQELAMVRVADVVLDVLDVLADVLGVTLLVLVLAEKQSAMVVQEDVVQLVVALAGTEAVLLGAIINVNKHANQAVRGLALALVMIALVVVMVNVIAVLVVRHGVEVVVQMSATDVLQLVKRDAKTPVETDAILLVGGALVVVLVAVVLALLDARALHDHHKIKGVLYERN